MKLLFVFTLALIAKVSAADAAEVPGFQAQIDAAVASGKTSLKIEPGVYHVSPPTPRAAHVSLRNVTDLAVDASGVTLICKSATPALAFEHCRGVTLRGLTIDYDPLSLTQGTIVAIAPDRRWTDVRIHAGYPAPRLHEPGQGFYWVYDRQTRLIKIGSANRAVDAIRDLGQGVYRLDHGKRRYADSAAAGDFIRMPQRFEAGHGIVQHDCRRVTLENITLYTCPGFGIAERGGSENVYRAVRIVPGPTPPGGSEPRLFSSMFDGINLAEHRVGPVVENCEIAYSGDDGIAVYSPIAIVVQAADGKTVTVAPAEDGNQFRPGDRLRFYRFVDTSVHDAALVLVDRATIAPEELRKLTLSFIPGAAPYLFRNAYRLTLDAPACADAGDMCANRAIAGCGFRIHNNRVFNTGSRGIVVNESGGSVRGNRIEQTFLPGIHMFSFAREGGSSFQEDVAITGNTLAWSCRGAPRRDGWCGAICVTSWDATFQTPAGHRKLLIADNEIRSAVGVNLQIHSAGDVTVRGNRFLDTHPVEDPQGGPRPVDNQAIVYLEQADAIRFENNRVQNLGPFASRRHLLVQGPGTGSITGAIAVPADSGKVDPGH